MGTHCLIFLTIANLVSPPGFPFAGKVKGRTGPPPPNEKSVWSRRPGKAGPSSRGVCCLAPATYETRCLLIGGGWTAWDGRLFAITPARCPRRRFLVLC